VLAERGGRLESSDAWERFGHSRILEQEDRRSGGFFQDLKITSLLNSALL
jgi:hypothetical protein